MTALQLYRDDGLLATWVAGRRAASRLAHPLAWVVPPLVRLVEFGALIALTAVSDPDAMPFCFALLGVLALRHHDIVYRLREYGSAPPAWARWIGGGWDGRLAAAVVLALAGVLGPALLTATVLLGLAYGVDSASSRRRLAAAPTTAPEDMPEVVE